MSKVRVRYAPSPTGIPHIGNIRTALFNFLFAKNQKGTFILRIEDTDRKRLIPGSISQIKESLKVLGLVWDEEYLQSERLPLYHKQLEVLKGKGLVYQSEGAWFFKVPDKKSIDWQDGVHGHVEFQTDVIEDFVVLKSDKFPTYHFASVVDDYEMTITHVIRGDEWISSTPKHLLLYQSFGWIPPKFIHTPPILGHDKKKLSKREGARSVLEYIADGYLPEALVNFLALLGWAPKGDQELFTLEELIQEFSLDRLNKNSPIFNLEKLRWLNGKWIRKLNPDAYTKKIISFYPNYNPNTTSQVTHLTQDRISTLADYSKITDFFYNPPTKIPPIPVSTGTISNVAETFDKSHDWNAQIIKGLTENNAITENVDRIDLISSIRNVVSGSTVTPPLYESLAILGKDETVKRLNKYVKRSKR